MKTSEIDLEQMFALGKNYVSTVGKKKAKIFKSQFVNIQEKFDQSYRMFMCNGKQGIIS